MGSGMAMKKKYAGVWLSTGRCGGQRPRVLGKHDFPTGDVGAQLLGDG